MGEAEDRRGRKNVDKKSSGKGEQAEKGMWWMSQGRALCSFLL